LATLQRVQRKRKQNREAVQLQQIIVAQEAAGDRAIEYLLYEEGARYYQDALNMETLAESDRVRISEKLGKAYFFGGKPIDAGPWFDRALVSHLARPEQAEKSIELLLRTAQQLWINAKTEESLPVIAQAIEIAKYTGVSRLWKAANIHMAISLFDLGRFSETTQYLDRVSQITDDDPISIRVDYYMSRGYLATVFGQEKQAYEALDGAIHYAKEHTDLYRVVSALGDSALCVMALGNIKLARSYCQQALFVARKNHLGWLIPVLCLGYARILMRMGQYSTAREYVVEALAVETATPLLDERFVEIGIPLALQLNDGDMLRRCVRTEEIERAFQSGEPAVIGIVTGVFAHFFANQGQESKASALLHRALGKVRSMDFCPDFPLYVAQYGAKADWPQARAILEGRVGIPSARVAEACLLLFDAFIEQRYGSMTKTHSIAAAAIEHFDALQWYGYADLSRALLPDSTKDKRLAETDRSTFSDILPTLTLRERQVFELVLKGLTNRKIAEVLFIKERTVESHMTSIMSQLGVRSRHQLMGVVEG
jgi:DNA-binding CsgD family transcriptional regulator